jgi:hypothetical protein
VLALHLSKDVAQVVDEFLLLGVFAEH